MRRAFLARRLWIKSEALAFRAWPSASGFWAGPCARSLRSAKARNSNSPFRFQHMAKKIRVLLADDHPAFRDGLRAAITAAADLQLVGEVSDGDAARRLIEELRPDVAVLDITMPRLSGLQVARHLQRQGSPASVVFLTMHNEQDMFDKAMDAGAKGYVLKESAVTDIVESIRTVASGRHYLSPGISHYLVQRAEHQETFRKTQSGLDSLTPTERRVLKLISHGPHEQGNRR